MLLERIKHDPSVLPAGKSRGWSVFQFIVSETKKSGLYGLLQKAAIDRLKSSGNYENLIKQVIDKESQLAGQPRSRAWAEKWIERQFDFGKVGANLKPNQPYFTPKWPHAVGRAVTNTNGTDMGSAAFFGSQSDIQANGVFDIKFSGNSDRLYYTVENKTTGEVTGPRPYDSRGTVIKANGLRAEMFGTPKPGDLFNVYKPDGDKSRGKDYDVFYRSSPISTKNERFRVFDSVFSPVIGPDRNTKLASDIVDDFISGPHGRRQSARRQQAETGTAGAVESARTSARPARALAVPV